MSGAYFIVTWLRSKANKLSLLALFALALQFGLTWGHFHSEGLVRFPAASTHTAQVQAPANGHDQDADHDLCAVCVTIAMAGSAVDATPPQLPLPRISALHQSAAVDHVTVLEQRRHVFQPRAPPQA